MIKHHLLWGLKLFTKYIYTVQVENGNQDTNSDGEDLFCKHWRR